MLYFEVNLTQCKQIFHISEGVFKCLFFIYLLRQLYFNERKNVL